MAISQAFGVAVFIARRVFDANNATTTITNGISATKPLTARRDFTDIGKFAPSPTRIAIANHDARKAAMTNGTMALAFAETGVRSTAMAAMPVWVATMKIASAKTTKAVLRLRQAGRERSFGCIVV